MKRKQTSQRDRTEVPANVYHPEASRREFLTGLAGTAVVSALSGAQGVAQAPDRALNVARVAIPSSYRIARMGCMR